MTFIFKKLIYITLNEYPAILFFEYFQKYSSWKLLIEKKKKIQSVFHFSVIFIWERKRCGKVILKKKKQTKQLKSQDKKTPPIIRSFIFSYFSAQSVVDFCLRRRCCMDNVWTRQDKKNVCTEGIRSNCWFLDTTTVLDSSSYSSSPSRVTVQPR
jgi:hypothetical protein